MSTTIYITGDRSMPPVPAVNVLNIIATKLLIDNPEGIRVITGDSPSGVERAVRYLFPEQSVRVLVREQDEEGHVNFDSAHEKIKDVVDKVIVIHTDSLNSRLAKSVAMVFDPTKVEYPLDEVLNQAPEDLSELFTDILPEVAKEDEDPK